MDLVVISVPYALERHREGMGAAPEAWQAAGLTEMLAPYLERAIWVSLPPPEAAGASQHEQLVAIGRRLRDTVRSVRAAGALPLVLGGDCLLTSLGTVAGLQAAGERPGVLWFDAHGDFNTPETSPSGLLIGMPLAMLAGRGDLALAQAIGVSQSIPEWHILLAGVRDLDPGEAEALEASDLTVWTAGDLAIGGADELGRDLGDWPPAYLHLDLDVLDPTAMPAVDYPAADGLAFETLVPALQAVAAGCRVIAASVTAFNPARDAQGAGLQTSLRAIEALVQTLAI